MNTVYTNTYIQRSGDILYAWLYTVVCAIQWWCCWGFKSYAWSGVRWCVWRGWGSQHGGERVGSERVNDSRG